MWNYKKGEKTLDNKILVNDLNKFSQYTVKVPQRVKVAHVFDKILGTKERFYKSDWQSMKNFRMVVEEKN